MALLWKSSRSSMRVRTNGLLAAARNTSSARLGQVPQRSISLGMATTPHYNLVRQKKSITFASSRRPERLALSSVSEKRRLLSSTPALLQSRPSNGIVIPTDPDGVIDSDGAAKARLTPILSQPTLVVTRELEMLNVFLGFEQANRYALVSPAGESKGYIAETEQGVGSVLQRQFFRTHRPFTAHVLDQEGKQSLVIRRGLKWLTSKTSVYLVDPETGLETLIGEVRQRLTLIRRKYDLFVYRRHQEAEKSQSQNEDDFAQFATIDGGLWTWDFVMVDADKQPLGAVSRNFRGFGRELFTDTGQYVVAFDPSGVASPSVPSIEGEQGQSRGQGQEKMEDGAKDLLRNGPARALTLDERAVALATAVSCDFDYFSHHSQMGLGPHGGGGGMLPFWMMSGGSQSQNSEAAAAAEGQQQQQEAPTQQNSDFPTRQDSSGVHAPTPAPGADGGWGPAIGTGIGYGMLSDRNRGGQDAGPSSPPPPYPSPSPQDQQQQQQQQPQYGEQEFAQGQEEVWGDGADPWAESNQPTGGDGGGWSLSDFLPGGGDGGWGE